MDIWAVSQFGNYKQSYSRFVNFWVQYGSVKRQDVMTLILIRKNQNKMNIHNFAWSLENQIPRTNNTHKSRAPSAFRETHLIYGHVAHHFQKYTVVAHSNDCGGSTGNKCGHDSENNQWLKSQGPAITPDLMIMVKRRFPPGP